MRKLIVAILLITAFAGNICADEKTASKLFEEGLSLYNAKKYTQAMITWKKAVEEGSGRAAARIGALYDMGAKDIEQNDENAVKWYNKAKEMGDPGANIFIAFLYLNGKTVSQDYSKAYQIVHEVEDLILTSDDLIPRNVYRFYLNGWGTPADLKKASEIALRILDKNDREEALKAIKEKETSDETVTAKFLVDEIEKNQLRFDKKYKGKAITCEGIVGTIAELKDGGYRLQLCGDRILPGPFDYVDCRFDQIHEGMLLELDKGDTVKIRGTYAGKQDFQIGKLTLFECVFVK
ncbi:MAG: SEL1-like repeat protein [Firmicutes bacterium]|nr:SEL1-like repeat protein [Bacillota bacterium]